VLNSTQKKLQDAGPMCKGVRLSQRYWTWDTSAHWAGSALNWQKQNRNRAETKQNQKWYYCPHTHTFDKKQTIPGCFNCVWSCLQSAVKWKRKLCGTSSEVQNKMRTYAWLRLDLYSSHHKYKKKKQEAFWSRPTVRKRKMYDSDELLVNLWIDLMFIGPCIILIVE